MLRAVSLSSCFFVRREHAHVNIRTQETGQKLLLSLAPLVICVVIFLSCMFHSMDQEKRETARILSTVWSPAF